MEASKLADAEAAFEAAAKLDEAEAASAAATKIAECDANIANDEDNEEEEYNKAKA